MIVCTHSHPDHSPGARPLQALCEQHSQSKPPILGLPSAPTAHANCAFTPDRPLQNAELLRLNGQTQKGNVSHTLQVIHTPGHAANHLCLVLLEDGLLFSGDHVLSGSTTLVDPPDGNMTVYLDSLDVLSAACSEHQIEFILPAHGHVIGGFSGEASAAIAQLKAHRLAREAKVVQAMQAQPEGTLDQWLEQVYDDVPTRMWPVAKRSLLAHIERIEAIYP
jgi:recombination protein RecT